MAICNLLYFNFITRYELKVSGILGDYGLKNGNLKKKLGLLLVN
jgi:hypothetical protein